MPAAAALLERRGNAHPLAAPLSASADIAALLDAGHTGWVTSGGYLLGLVDGDEAWVQYAGHAAVSAAAYRALYRAAARAWVDAGAYRHAVVMPEGDAVAGEAFANLAFGREHVFALASLADQPGGAWDGHVRVGSGADYEALRPLFDLVARHLEGSPVFSPRGSAYYETLPDEYREDVDDPDVTYLLYEEGGRVLGFATWQPMPARVRVPDGAFALSHMAVLPECRGHGIGNALTVAGLALARERRATVTWSDWRLTNMDAEPHWRTYGWTPYLVRMTRRVEPPR
jgi:GNAT superfamily N-acetyltransferase